MGGSCDASRLHGEALESVAPSSVSACGIGGRILVWRTTRVTSTPCSPLVALLIQVKWRKPVRPGDVFVMEMELLTWKPKFGIAKMTGRAFVDGSPAVDVKEFTFFLKND